MDENEENQKELETCKNKIFRTDIKGENDRLIMNRISARKSRLKKKKYIKQLEEESAVLKNNFLLNNKNKNSSLGEYSEMNKLFLNKINLLESQEKEIKAEGQKKCANLMKQYESLQKTILNRRYFSLTDIIKFGEDRIELELLPKYYFKDIIDDLLNEELLDKK